MRVGNLDAQVRAALFGAGQGGYMLSFDRADGLYQDNTGVIPVGSVGNPLGLVLDQRYGLTRGAQLVRNADFATDISVWSTVNATRAWDNGRAFVTTSVANGRMEQGVLGGLVPGRLYEVVGNIELGTAADVTIRTIRDAAGSYANIASSRQTSKSGPLEFRFAFIAPAADCIIQAATNDAAGTFWVDYIYIRDIQGSHFQQATATARPTRQQDAQGYWYANFDGTDDALASIAAVPFSAYNTVTAMAAYTNGVFLEVTAQASNTDGAFRLSSGATTSAFTSRGTTYQAAVINHADITGTKQQVAGQANISTPVVRISGPFGGYFTSSATQGTGNYNNAIHYLGARAGNTGYVAGGLYGLLVVSSVLSDREIALARAWLKSKMGA